MCYHSSLQTYRVAGPCSNSSSDMET